MRRDIFCAFTALLCVLGTEARLRLRGLAFSLDDVLNDMTDRGVECTASGSSKYKYAEALCDYLECRNNKYELRTCPDGIGVSRDFKIRDTSRSNPCSPRFSECKKSLTEKGVDIKLTETCGIDLLFILDMSFSISLVNKVKIRSFVIEMVNQLRLGDAFTQVAGSTYGADTKPFLRFSDFNSPNGIRDAIKNMETDPKKGTATNLALREAREVHLTRKSGRRYNTTAVCIVMTDGITHPHENSPETIKEAKKLKDPKSYEDEKWISPPKVVLVNLPNSKEGKTSGVSQEERDRLDRIKREEFAAIPSEGEGFRFDLGDFNQLQSIIAPILQSSCKRV